MRQAAAGYESVRGSIYAPAKITMKIVQNYGACSVASMLCNSNFLSDEDIFCGSKVVYGVEQEFNMFSQDTHNNEHPETLSGPGVDYATMTVCNSRKFEIKISNMDRRAMCGNFAQWEANIRKQIDKQIRLLLNAYTIAKIVASAHPDNVGKKAGQQSHSWDLGSETNPLVINSVDAFEEMINSLINVADEAGVICEGGGESFGGDHANPVFVIPRQLRAVAIKYLKSLNTCCSDNNVLVSGVIGTIQGIKVLMTGELRPYTVGGNNNLVQVLLVDPNVCLHAFDIVKNDWWTGKHEDYLVGEFAWETHVFNPRGVIVAVARKA